MNAFDRRALERVRHLPGERLRGRDFRAQAAIDDQLRWWHNRALHQAYGVATGMEVRDSATMKRPMVGAAAVEISPGVAYDAYGREIISPFPVRRAVPKIGDWTLVVSYRMPVRVEPPPPPSPAPQLPAPCPSACDIGGVTTAVFTWVPPPAAPSRDAVSLVTFRANGEVKVHTTFTHAMARPLVASGETRLGFTPWIVWKVAEVGSLGLETEVDTSAALFAPEHGVPCYFAWLNEVIEVGQDSDKLPQPRGFFGHVAPGADHRRFTFRVLMRNVSLTHGEAANRFGDTGAWLAFGEHLQVCWLGVQCLTCLKDLQAEDSGE